ncbi:MAG: type IX secretion system sortase PorU [Candidatus Latescibacteria bacterium]|nr:type IX secretion system sortase PorU [Candidatus Latescibacterota bacterium]
MRSARIVALFFALALTSGRATAGVDRRTVSDTNGRVVVELADNDDTIGSQPVTFFCAISPTGTYSARYRVGPAAAPGLRAEAGIAIDSVTVSPPFPMRGTRMIRVRVNIPVGTPISNVTIDYTPAAEFNDAARADPLVKSMVVNRNVFPIAPRTALNDPWFSRAPIWLKLTVATRGMHAVSGGDLAAEGVTLATIDPATLRVFTSGGLNQARAYSDPTGSWRPGQSMREIPIRVEAGGDGTFDPGDRIYFYGVATQDWADVYDPTAADTLYHEHTHAKSTVYFLTWGGSLGGTPARIGDLPSAPTADPDVTTYRHREYRERDLVVDYDYRGDGWLWLDLFPPSTSRTRLSTIDVRNLVESRPQTFRTVALAKYVVPTAPTGSNFGHRAVYFNYRNGLEVLIGDKIWDGNSGDNFYESGRPVRIDGSYLVEGSNEFRLQMPGNLNPEDRMLFAWFSVWYQRRIRAVGNAAGFSSPDTTGAVNFRADGFGGTDAIHVFDVTDAWNPVRVTGFEETAVTGGRRVRFSSAHAGIGRHFWVATTGGMLEPGIARFTPIDLRAATSAPHLLIVTHRDLRAAADRLRSYRAAGRVPLVNNPVVDIVTTDHIFDNFSQGMPDPMALRNYIKFLYDNYPDANGNPKLAYVCLLGDASTDFRNNVSAQPDYVPSNLYFTRLAPFTFVTDEWFGHMDPEDQVPGADVLDVAIGRLPGTTAAEAEFLVERVIDYETASPLEDWRQEVIFVADDEISSFEGVCETSWTVQSELLTFTHGPDFMNVTKIYLTEYPEIAGVKPTSRFDFLDEWNEGALLINFIGHGSSQQMADEQVFLGTDVSQLSNGLKLPMMMAFSCTIGDFANPAGKSLSEDLMLHEAGGIIAALTASRESYPGPNGVLNQSVYDILLPRHLDQGVLPLGVGLMQAKAESQARQFLSPNSSENSWKYNLLGDPAATLRIPRREIRFLTAGSDTLAAGTRSSLRGVVYQDGAPDPTFTGTVEVQVREPDARRVYETRCTSPRFMNYHIPGGVMYDGTADVTNGEFEVSFRVPRYAATGTLAAASAYAHQGGDDAGATIDSVLVVVSPSLADTLALEPIDGAPRVNLGFKSGLTMVKPGDTVRALVRDQDGINILATTNEGKQAILIDKLPLPIDVNEFFTFDHGGIDTSGALLFPLPDLAPGSHRLVYKVSDSFGSTTLDTLTFDVTDVQDYYAEAVLNYPNPFATSTQLLFRISNRASIQLEIYTVSGKRVRTIDDVRDGGEAWIEWDGRDAGGGDLANGTYLYVATVDFVGLERAPVVLRGKMSKIR